MGYADTTTLEKFGIPSKAKTQAPCQSDAPTTSPLCRFSKEMRACCPQTLHFRFTQGSQNNETTQCPPVSEWINKLPHSQINGASQQ